jgi:membrane fusion protein, copper/silver efflux system
MAARSLLRGVQFTALLLIAFALGYTLNALLSPAPSSPVAPPMTEEPAMEEIWTCSMDPQVRLPKPGPCPICGMDLILAATDSGDASMGDRHFVTSEAAKALMAIQTSPVERRFVEAEVRMVGKVDFDETKLSYITAWVPGRIDRMYVDYTGIEVKEGDHLVYLYSPDLLSAQDELRRSAKAVETMRDGAPEVLKETTRATLEAARSKLRRWGLTDGQIRTAEKEGNYSDHVTIYAPMSGTVIHRDGQEGMYVDTGSRLYTLADLNEVWVKLDAYESDLPWLHYGQTVEFSTVAHPGEVFRGQIAFIDPVLDPNTRTAKVRVNVPNEDGRLKPEMFVRAMVRAQVATGGRVMNPNLAGKWISPMHPEIVKDAPGSCDICGMALVKAEELGYVPLEAEASVRPLVIPASAPLITGTRAVVYVEVPGAERPTYEGREIALGPRAGAFYLVKDGLREGERVVTNGNFKIDSALQIQAKPSMMSPEGGVPGGHVHGSHTEPARREARDDNQPQAQPAPSEFQGQLRGVVDAYLELHKALAGDDAVGAAQALQDTTRALSNVDMSLLEGDAHVAWMELLPGMKAALKEMAESDQIEVIRKPLASLSDELAEAVTSFGLGTGGQVYLLHCPMALGGQGANWLQSDTATRNPYYGASMLSCGSVVEHLTGGTPSAPSEGSSHEGHGEPVNEADASPEVSHAEGSSHE